MSRTRDYRTEYDDFHAKPEQIKNRAMRNAARRKAMKEGRVHKGDGKEIDHIKPIRSGGGNGGGNLRVMSKSANRSRNGK